MVEHAASPLDRHAAVGDFAEVAPTSRNEMPPGADPAAGSVYGAATASMTHAVPVDSRTSPSPMAPAPRAAQYWSCAPAPTTVRGAVRARRRPTR